MEIFRSIADNCIKGRTQRRLALGLSCLLLLILTVGCSGMEDRLCGQPDEASAATVVTVDAVTGYSGAPADEEPEAQVRLADFTGTASTPDESEEILRENNRTETETKLLSVPVQDDIEAVQAVFDLCCKTGVCEGKVRQGIFHFRLQSDDEEAPGPEPVTLKA